MTTGTRVSLRGWRIQGVRVPYRRALRWNDNVLEDHGTYALLRLETAEGFTGVAETIVKPTWSGASIRSLRAVLEDVLIPRLAGVDLADQQAVASAMAAVPENQSAKLLIDNACWDIRSQACGQPLWKLLGGQAEVDLSWILTRAAPAQMREEAQAVVSRYGFKTLKIKGGQGLDVDVEAVRSIRHCVGEGVRLYVDANWQYDAEVGLTFAQAMADEGVFMVEDPWTLEPDDVLRNAASRLRIPILVDQFCAGRRDVAPFARCGAGAISVKPGRMGISAAIEISRLCTAHRMTRVAGTFAEGLVGSIHSLSFASTLGDGLPAEGSFFLMLADSPFLKPLTVKDGRVTLCAQPGIGLEIDWSAIARSASAQPN